ncbi:vacuolar (H+)-ATPase G subunit domain-containing protein, putative [Eimeria necatrix]|uniref:Vacuolar (H+)-ATPase G subunit domain-containing protein, putative n=1 Tax=Eimeria necatrix TaxID=51315 RepID=U6MYX4_9EIME|nr:vacuolar (H+)-ATPase G subunit domain-containing protein, putative [Eimeria necatrix]CDJ69151.1 vacuolar (H+)-ATPase G subunit domain-containing protein, putative [Eimeria necatrix]
MPFRFSLRRPVASRKVSQQSGTDLRGSKDQLSLVEERNDEQCGQTDATNGPNNAVLRTSVAHAASPAATMESRPSSFLRRTLSSLSMRVMPKMRSDSSKGSRERAQMGLNSDVRSDQLSGGIRPGVEAPNPADLEHTRRGFHSLRQRFHAAYHPLPGRVLGGQDGTSEHALHMPIPLRHLHLPHILEGRLHHSSHPIGLTSADQEAEVMQMLQNAANHAKRIIQTAKSERETLRDRAREEAEEEIRALRQALEEESLRAEESINGADLIRLATKDEDERMRQLVECSAERMAGAVTLCVDHVLNVDTTLAPERRDALRHLKKNPPSFLRKSQAGKYPSMRRELAVRALKNRRNLSYSDHFWDSDALDYPQQDGCTLEQEQAYAAILGDRTFKEEDEIKIDFDELERPSPVERFSLAVQSIGTRCGCLLG